MACKRGEGYVSLSDCPVMSEPPIHVYVLCFQKQIFEDVPNNMLVVVIAVVVVETTVFRF